MAVAIDRTRRSSFHENISHPALFITFALLFARGTQAAPQNLTCDEDQTSLYFNGKICENRATIEVSEGPLLTVWHCCSAVPFDDVYVVAAVIIPEPETYRNVSMSLRNFTTPLFDKNNPGMSGVLYSYEEPGHLSSAEAPLTILWEDTIISGGNRIVRRHECKLHAIPSNQTTDTVPPNEAGSTSPESSTTESSALTFYAVNKLFFLVSFLVVACIIIVEN
ncbi:unnamed protein product [Allacma fusca]|uniref:Uncharacterized protein n=1 Tax=Allacma fusca TaxID=39272 RepID=A0A8J2PFZ5_9HEXA|nr:unnamed protein product [Allacma fusca]